MKESYEENQCDLWFDYVQDGRGEKAHFEFFVHTRENQRKQKEAADEVLKEYRGILTFLRATIKKDPKYIERVSKQLELEIEKVTPIYHKFLELQKDFSGASLAKMARWILKTDYNIK